MKDKFDTGPLFSNLLTSKEHLSKGLAIAVFILVGNWPDNIEVLLINVYLLIYLFSVSTQKTVNYPLPSHITS